MRKSVFPAEPLILISRNSDTTSRNSDKEKVLGQYYYPDDD